MQKTQQVCRLPLRYCVPGMKVGGRIAAGSCELARKGARLDIGLIDSLSKCEISVVPIILDENSYDIYDDFRVNKSEVQSKAERLLGYKSLRRELSAMYSGERFSGYAFRSVVERLARQVPNVGREGVFACVDGVRDVDAYLLTHSLNVSLLSYLMAEWMGIKGSDTLDLMYAGLVHDVGMLKVEPEITYKTDAIGAEEMRAIKQHPDFGRKMLKESGDIPDTVIDAAYCHHERFNGSGYPRGLRGSEIPLYSRIIAICDMYDAMMANKVYRNRQSSFHVFDVLMSDKMNGKLDKAPVDVFLSQLSRSFVGRGVFLEDGRVGQIISMNPDDFSRPMVRIGNRILDTAAANIGVSDV